jgi:hypothetical protein
MSGSAVNKLDVRFDGAKRDYRQAYTVSPSQGAAPAKPRATQISTTRAPLSAAFSS